MENARGAREGEDKETTRSERIRKRREERKKGKEGTEKNWLQVTGLRMLLHARYRDHPARNFALANF